MCQLGNERSAVGTYDNLPATRNDILLGILTLFPERLRLVRIHIVQDVALVLHSIIKLLNPRFRILNHLIGDVRGRVRPLPTSAVRPGLCFFDAAEAGVVGTVYLIVDAA